MLLAAIQNGAADVDAVAVSVAGLLLCHARLTGRHLAPRPQHYCALRARHKYLCAGELRELPNAARKKESDRGKAAAEAVVERKGSGGGTGNVNETKINLGPADSHH